jgi:hypothetical protein
MKFTITKLFRRSKKQKEGKFNYDRDPNYRSGPGADFNHGGRNGYNGYDSGNRNGFADQGPLYNGVFAPWLQLPTPILQNIFSFVCPHTSDESYETCEQSAIEDSCMLCDVRDLAHAGMACKAWRKAAIPVM